VNASEQKYKQSIGRVSTKNELQLNQSIAVSLMALDFPLRLDKFSLEIISDENREFTVNYLYIYILPIPSQSF
jgi:hypothetical protein